MAISKCDRCRGDQVVCRRWVPHGLTATFDQDCLGAAWSRDAANKLDGNPRLAKSRLQGKVRFWRAKPTFAKISTSPKCPQNDLLCPIVTARLFYSASLSRQGERTMPLSHCNWLSRIGRTSGMGRSRRFQWQVIHCQLWNQNGTSINLTAFRLRTLAELP